MQDGKKKMYIRKWCAGKVVALLIKPSTILTALLVAVAVVRSQDVYFYIGVDRGKNIYNWWL